MSASHEFSIEAQISELQAELKLRRESYPRLISRGHMRSSEGELKIARNQAAVATLSRVRHANLEAQADRQMRRS